MLNISRNDLTKKTDEQLSFLFYQAQNTKPRKGRLCPIFNAAHSALNLIRQEIAARKLSLK